LSVIFLKNYLLTISIIHPTLIYRNFSVNNFYPHPLQQKNRPEQSWRVVFILSFLW